MIIRAKDRVLALVLNRAHKEVGFAS